MNSPSVEPVLRSRLLPRVSFRFVFLLTAIAAVIAAVARAAGGGMAGARALLIAGGFLVVCFVLFVLLFLICWLISSLWYQGESETAKGSPFADGQLPPQILPPREQQS